MSCVLLLSGQRNRDRDTPTIPEKTRERVDHPLPNETGRSDPVRGVLDVGQIMEVRRRGNQTEQNLFMDAPLHTPRAR